MYVYNYGYGTYEESSYLQLIHEKKFTDDELRKYVLDIMVRAIKKISANSNFEMDQNPTFETVIDSDEFRDELIASGFCRLKFEASVEYFGWANCLGSDHWKNEMSDEQKKDIEYLKSKITVKKKSRRSK